MSDPRFVHLRVHSEFSIADGIVRLDDVVKAVNSSAAGVTASKVAAGTDPDTGKALYRLQFTAAETGAANAFEVASGGTEMLPAAGAAIITQGSDASVLLYAGTPAQTRLTSASNDSSAREP